MSADQVFADYDRWLQRQALAARTRASYRRWVSELVAHLDAGDELAAFLARDGEHHVAPSSATGAGASSIAASRPRRSTSRSRRRRRCWTRARCRRRAYLASRSTQRHRARFSPAQLLAVERETDRLGSSRDRAIMELLLRTGVRIGELADLDVGDVRLTRRLGELVIRHGKADRRRIVPLNRAARAALRTWLTNRQDDPTAPARDHGPLWISRTGEQLSVRSITNLVTKVMAAAGVEETAHGLRHMLATRLVRDDGRDLALVADVLGHADVKTMRRHARSELEDRRAALEALDRRRSSRRPGVR